MISNLWVSHKYRLNLVKILLLVKLFYLCFMYVCQFAFACLCLGHYGSNLALLGLTWPYLHWGLLGLTGPDWALLGLTGPNWALTME